MSFFFNITGLRSLKLFFAHIGQDFGHSYAFFHLYLICLSPRNTTLTTDYGILTISTLSIPLFFRGQGFPHMSILDQNMVIVFWYSCHICHRFKRVSLAIFHTILSLILVSFYKLSFLKTQCHYGVSLGPSLTPQNRLDCRVNLSIQAH